MEDAAGIYARFSPYLDRYVQIGVAGGKVVHLSFPDDPDENAESEHEMLDRIDDYLTGTVEDDFDDVQIALTVPTEHRAVLETVRKIPYGKGMSVDRIARLTAGLDAEEGEDLETVRTALAENPVPLLLPDHRVRDGPSAAPPSVEQRLRSLEEIVA